MSYKTLLAHILAAPITQKQSAQHSTRGGHSHRRRVQSCDRGQDAVKRSRHFLGVGQTVKQCAGALSTALLVIKRRGRSFCACAVNRWSRAKSGVVKRSSGQGRFSTVKNLDPGCSSGHGAYGSDPPPTPRSLLVNFNHSHFCKIPSKRG